MRRMLPTKARIHQNFQFAGHVGALRLAAGGAHLQVIGGGSFVSVLRGLQESEDGAGGRVASERIGGSGTGGGADGLSRLVTWASTERHHGCDDEDWHEP